MMKESRKIVVALVLAAAGVVTLASCQTVQGLGKDVEYAGSKTEEKILESQKK